MAKVIELAHQHGAQVYVDAVHYAHHLIDVQQLNCDFLACSACGSFDPHVGIAYVAPPMAAYFKALQGVLRLTS